VAQGSRDSRAADQNGGRVECPAHTGGAREGESQRVTRGLKGGQRGVERGREGLIWSAECGVRSADFGRVTCYVLRCLVLGLKGGSMVWKRGGEGQRGAERGREGQRGAERGREGQRGAERGREGQRGAERGREGQRGAERGREGQRGAERGREGQRGAERGREGQRGADIGVTSLDLGLPGTRYRVEGFRFSIPQPQNPEPRTLVGGVEVNVSTIYLYFFFKEED